MVEKLSVEIGLKVTGVNEAAQSFEQATKSIAALGSTGKEALEGAAAAAKKFGASANELAGVEGVIKAINARANDSSTAFSVLATNYDKARASAAGMATAIASAQKEVQKAEGAFGRMGNAGLTAVKALDHAFQQFGNRLATSLGPLAGVARALGPIGIAAAAVGAGSVALVKFASAAVETNRALTELQKVSGQSLSNLSAMAIAFEKGGTGVKQFATEFGNLSEKIAAAGEQAAKQDAISKQAEDAAKGLKVTSLAAITLDERVTALLQTLSRVPPEQQWFALADIFKNLGSEVERARLGKALGLSPESIATLSLGSTKLQQMAEQARALGLALDGLDQKNLSQLRQSQTEAGALFDALKDKIGALVAPAVASFWQGFTSELQRLIPVFTQIGQAFGQIDFSRLGAAAADFLAVLGKIAVGWASILSGNTSFADVISQIFQTAGQALISLAVQIGVAMGQGIIQGIISAIQAGAGAIWFAIKQALGISGGATGSWGSDSGGATGEFAGGGLLGGRGTGTSDSNLAWVSRGEHIMPARAVAQPGVLAFLEALRRSGGNLSRVLDGMGRFALGGMVPRAMPAFAGGGLAGGMSNVTIQFPGLPAIGGLRASSAVVDELHRAAALAQVRSGGRKPSRYS